MTGKVAERTEWADGSAGEGIWRGEWEGGVYGANICTIFVHIEKLGGGPRLHQHPYPETFVIRKGRALFTVGDRQFEAVEGQIVVCPANVPHKFENLGPGVLEQIDIHEAGRFSTEWLE